MSEFRWIGKSPIRKDVMEKVTGEAKFAGDYYADGMVYGKIITSPYAHARILKIDAGAAEKLPGYIGIVTGADAPDTRYGGFIRDRHILCKEIVRYVGDYVAVVCATSKDLAEQAAKLVEVEYEELPYVLDYAEAFKEDAVKVHENLLGYVGTGFMDRDIEKFGLSKSRPNQFTTVHHEFGNVDEGYAASDLIVENTYTFPLVSHCTMETHQALAIPGVNGDLTIYASEQGGLQGKYDIAAALEMDPSSIHFHIPSVGGGFGAKTGSTIAFVASLAALKLGRPVHIAESRQECFESGEPRGSGCIYIKDGYRKDGKLMARYLDVRINGGAYSTHALTMILSMVKGPLGNFKAENLRMDAYGIFTNTPPTGPYRALGGELTEFAMERNMNIAAKKLGIGQYQIRLVNVLTEGMIDCDNRPVHSNGSKGCLEEVIKRFDIHTKRAPEGPWVYGKSVTLGNKFMGVEDPNGSSAYCKIHDDGSVDLYNFHVELGQGARTTDAMCAAEVLNIPYEKVRVVACDSDTAPYDMGTFCSRGTFVHGNGAIWAAQDALRQLYELASEKLGVPVERLTTKDFLIWDTENPDVNIRWQDIVSLYGASGSQPQILGQGKFVYPYNPRAEGNHDPLSFSIGSWGMEVGINTETGEIKLMDLVGIYDCGRVINRKSCEGQVEGSFSMGLGQACFEEILLNDKGKVINGSYRDYRIPTFMDGPRNDALHVDFYEELHRYGPNGAKGIGEVAMIPVIAGVANAISDALDIQLNDLPLTRERVLKAIQASKV